MTASIDRLFAFIAVDDGGEGEGIVAQHIPGMGWAPMVGADMERVESFRPMAQELANASGRRIVLTHFEKRTDVEILEPNGSGNAGTHIIGGM